MPFTVYVDDFTRVYLHIINIGPFLKFYYLKRGEMTKGSRDPLVGPTSQESSGPLGGSTLKNPFQLGIDVDRFHFPSPRRPPWQAIVSRGRLFKIKFYSVVTSIWTARCGRWSRAQQQQWRQQHTSPSRCLLCDAGGASQVAGLGKGDRRPPRSSPVSRLPIFLRCLIESPKSSWHLILRPD